MMLWPIYLALFKSYAIMEDPGDDKLYSKTKRRIEKVESLDQATWVNVYPPFEHGELDALSTKMDIPLDFITDSLDVDERSRFEKEDSSTLILINSPILNEEEKIVRPFILQYQLVLF